MSLLCASWLIVVSGMKRYYEKIAIIFSTILFSLRDIIRSQSPQSYTILGNILKFVMDIPLLGNIFSACFWTSCVGIVSATVIRASLSVMSSCIMDLFFFLVQVGSIDDHYVLDEDLSSSTTFQALYLLKLLRQLRGGVNKLLLCLNNFKSINTILIFLQVIINNIQHMDNKNNEQQSHIRYT
jgi:hypothetical protein